MEKERLISLVQAAQRGEEQAFTELFEAFHDDLYYHIYKAVNDRELAEDLLQESYIEIFQTIDRLNEPAAFVTWSKQIAYHRCTGYFKKRRELLADEDEDGHSVFDAIEEDRAEFIPDEALDLAELKQTIHAMINDLPEEQRTAILMRYYDEISLKEIADIQGVPENTVKSRLNYGRKSIKEAVESYEKKHGIKLRCVGVVPLLLWLFRETAKDKTVYAASAASAAVGGSATAGTTTGAAGTAASVAGAGAAVAAGATVAKTVGILGMQIALPKLIAGIIAAAVAVGCIVSGTVLLTNKTATPESSRGNSTQDAPASTEPEHTEPATEETTAPEASNPSSNPSITLPTPKKWMGFGKIYDTPTKRFEFTVYSISETYIRGHLLLELHNEVYHETVFDGEGKVGDNIIEYTLHYETPGLHNYTEMKVYYYPDTDHFEFKDTLLYKAKMYRVIEPGELYNENVTFSGYGIDNHTYSNEDTLFTWEVYEQRGIHISGKLSVSRLGKYYHITEFTGYGVREENKIKYEINFETYREDWIGFKIKDLWVVYDVEAQTFSVPYTTESYEFTVTKDVA